MQQVVDLQNSQDFKKLDVELLAISPDPVGAWQSEGAQLGITTPMLSDNGNRVWFQYGVPAWMMPSNEPGHTFVLIGMDGKVAWVRDYGAPEHGGAMYVSPSELDPLIEKALGGA